jgi:hypothetical protein
MKRESQRFLLKYKDNHCEEGTRQDGKGSLGKMLTEGRNIGRDLCWEIERLVAR